MEGKEQKVKEKGKGRRDGRSERRGKGKRIEEGGGRRPLAGVQVQEH